jgi:prevent-host-death family protein
MTTVNIKDAKNRLNELVRKSEKGEVITITRNGEPVADIVPHKKRKTPVDFDAVTQEFKRKHGIEKIVAWVSPDFDDPLPEDFLITPLPDFDKPKPPRKA